MLGNLLISVAGLAIATVNKNVGLSIARDSALNAFGIQRPEPEKVFRNLWRVSDADKYNNKLVREARIKCQPQARSLKLMNCQSPDDRNYWRQRWRIVDSMGLFDDDIKRGSHEAQFLKDEHKKLESKFRSLTNELASNIHKNGLSREDALHQLREAIISMNKVHGIFIPPTELQEELSYRFESVEESLRRKQNYDALHELRKQLSKQHAYENSIDEEAAQQVLHQRITELFPDLSDKALEAMLQKQFAELNDGFQRYLQYAENNRLDKEAKQTTQYFSRFEKSMLRQFATQNGLNANSDAQLLVLSFSEMSKRYPHLLKDLEWTKDNPFPDGNLRNMRSSFFACKFYDLHRELSSMSEKDALFHLIEKHDDYKNLIKQILEGDFGEYLQAMLDADMPPEEILNTLLERGVISQQQLDDLKKAARLSYQEQVRTLQIKGYDDSPNILDVVKRKPLSSRSKSKAKLPTYKAQYLSNYKNALAMHKKKNAENGNTFSADRIERRARATAAQRMLKYSAEDFAVPTHPNDIKDDKNYRILNSEMFRGVDTNDRRALSQRFHEVQEIEKSGDDFIRHFLEEHAKRLREEERKKSEVLNAIDDFAEDTRSPFDDPFSMKLDRY